jgi:hypothetical protein
MITFSQETPHKKKYFKKLLSQLFLAYLKDIMERYLLTARQVQAKHIQFLEEIVKEVRV